MKGCRLRIEHVRFLALVSFAGSVFHSWIIAFSYLKCASVNRITWIATFEESMDPCFFHRQTLTNLSSTSLKVTMESCNHLDYDNILFWIKGNISLLESIPRYKREHTKQVTKSLPRNKFNQCRNCLKQQYSLTAKLPKLL